MCAEAFHRNDILYEIYGVHHLGSGLFRFSRIFLDILSAAFSTHNVKHENEQICCTFIYKTQRYAVLCFRIESKQSRVYTEKNAQRKKKSYVGANSADIAPLEEIVADNKC